MKNLNLRENKMLSINIVNVNKKIIKIYEQKIKDNINEVWGK